MNDKNIVHLSGAWDIIMEIGAYPCMCSHYFDLLNV